MLMDHSTDLLESLDTRRQPCLSAHVRNQIFIKSEQDNIHHDAQGE